MFLRKERTAVMRETKIDTQPIHKELADEVLKTLPQMDNILELADFFKVMGDGTRLQILIALIQNEFCVSD